MDNKTLELREPEPLAQTIAPFHASERPGGELYNFNRSCTRGSWPGHSQHSSGSAAADAAMGEESRLHVVALEGCEEDFRLEVQALEESGFDVSAVRVGSVEELRKALETRDWQVVISDYSLSWLDGFHAVKLVRAMRQDLPLIIVSGEIDEAQAVEAMRAGAQDYVYKGNLPRLGRAVRREMHDFELRQRSHHAEMNLVRAENRFRIAALTSNDVIFDWDLGPKVDYFGDVARMLGYDPGEFPHTVDAWKEALHPDDRDRVLATLGASLSEGTPYAAEYRVLGKGGAVYWWSVRGALAGEAGKNTTRLIGTVADITQRVRREEDLRQRNKELEEFTYTVSHDLRSPLVTIQTFVGYLQRDLAAGEMATVATDLSYIRGGATKMARLIDYLLDISRVGRVVNPPVSVSMRSLVDEVLAAIAGRIVERGVLVTIDEADVTLYADRVRLSQIFQNLIENAVKYMGNQPSPRLWVGVERPGSDCVFYVRDNGIGIEARFLNKIFNLFEKLDRNTDGAGFGLALVKRVVQLYEGRVWAESAGLEQGSCFRFTLPAAVRK